MLHLMKIAVGIDSIQHLQIISQQLAAENNGFPYTLTRHAPKQTDELLQNGSLYRIIKGIMCCRQRIRGFSPTTRETGEPRIQIDLEPEIIQVVALPIRPFQGWRYLQPNKAPPDLSSQQISGSLSLSDSLQQDLHALCLL